MAANLLAVNRREERNRYLAILLFAAPGAAIVWYVFHAVYVDLSASEKAVGYVDSMTQAGIDFGYVAMIGGTLLLAAIAAWAAFQLLRLLIRGER